MPGSPPGRRLLWVLRYFPPSLLHRYSVPGWVGSERRDVLWLGTLRRDRVEHVGGLWLSLESAHLSAVANNLPSPHPHKHRNKPCEGRQQQKRGVGEALLGRGGFRGPALIIHQQLGVLFCFCLSSSESSSAILLGFASDSEAAKVF